MHIQHVKCILYPTKFWLCGIKVQIAQQLGMMTLQSANGLIITSGVLIKSVVNALDHHGRILDVLTLPTLIWKLADSPKQQFPYGRGIC